jgi:hypothetical protein
MTPQEQGRHCDKCNIVVQDFTGMSNEEILRYLNKNTGSVCGRANEEQLLGIPKFTDKVKRFLYAFAIAFLPLFGLTTTATIISTEVHAQSNTGGIVGKVINKKGEPIPFASVGVFQGDILLGQGKTNFKGNYKIKLLEPGTCTLKISSVGYDKIEIKNITVSNNYFTQNLKMKRSHQRVQRQIIGLISKPIVDPMDPGKREISGDEIRDMLGD